LVLIAGAMACVGCQRVESSPGVGEQVVHMIAPPPGAKFREFAPAADAAAAPAADAAAAPASMAEPAMVEPAPAILPATAPRIAAGPPMLAYSYDYGLAVPQARVDGLRRTHEAACLKAGWRVCQVVSSSMQDLGGVGASGQLEIRAVASWLTPFRAGLEAQAKGAGGRVTTTSVSSEDLSREIVDTEAQLRAKTTLRDRLQALLANRPGKLSDLLEVERELARVQGEIDSTTSQLAVMRARVAMSDLTLRYQSGDVVGPRVRSPLGAAFGGFLGNAAASFAAIVDVVAVVLPWGLLLAALGWLFRKPIGRLRQRLRQRRAPKPDDTSTEPAQPITNS
jgi:hypothetical protein